ncbi:aminopeptidase, putative, partial [Ixodes scapularis]
SRVNTSDRLKQLRHLLSKENFQGYIIPSEDAHKSEFVPNHYKRRQYITGFSGDTGTAVVLKNSAALWVEGRYMLQAEEQLDCNWVLMNGGQTDVPVIEEWFKSNLHGSSKVAIDSRVVPFQEYRKMEENLHPFGIELVGEPRNLVDEIWTTAEGRPGESNASITVHNIEFAGESWQDKVRKVREFLKKSGIDAIFITDLGEIAWLYNLRGNDVPYTPVFEAFVTALELARPLIFFMPFTFQWKNYRLVYNEMNVNGNSVNRLLVSPFCSYAICGHIDVVRCFPSIDYDKLVVSEAPVKMMMTVKNNIELRGLKNAHLKDSIVFVILLARMEKDFLANKPWTEVKIIHELARLRSQQHHYRGESFSTVAAVGPHTSMANYATRTRDPGVVLNGSVILIDSGAQYLDGTTDIARTVYYGVPSKYEKEIYTRVLIGMIDLFLTVFPEGTKDISLDVVARRSLWSVGLDFLHGVSHGLGSYMSAHERKPQINCSLLTDFDRYCFVKLTEPGFYEEDKFGIRLETTMAVSSFNTSYRFMSQRFCRFEPITFVPFDANLISWELLSRTQVEWLNDYNARTLDMVGSELKRMKNPEALAWLQAKTFKVE